MHKTLPNFTSIHNYSKYITQGLLCTTTSEGQDTDSSNLGVMAAGFYFMPFVITVLTVVGVPVINTIAVQG